MDTIVKRLIENRMHEDFDPMFDEDLKKYKGKPMKELLAGLDGKVKINIECDKKVSHYGLSGFSGMCNQVTWDYADMPIEDIRASDNRYVDVYVQV